MNAYTILPKKWPILRKPVVLRQFVKVYNSIESRPYKNFFQKSVLVERIDFLPAWLPAAGRHIDPCRDNNS